MTNLQYYYNKMIYSTGVANVSAIFTIFDVFFISVILILSCFHRLVNFLRHRQQPYKVLCICECHIIYTI